MRDASTPQLGFSAVSLDSGVAAFVRHHTRRDVFAALFGGESHGHYLGRYKLLRLVGQGGVGVVFSAHDETLDRKVAVKLVQARGDGHARLLRESQALARLSHPNVVHVYEIGETEVDLDLGEDGETPRPSADPKTSALAFIVMEFVDGETLDAWLATDPPRAQILEAFASAGRGLAAAHEAGLVHRDFKPQNVMLGNDGRIRVMDFGLARDGEGPAMAPVTQKDHSPTSPLRQRLTQTQAVIGTPLYMAPEQLAGQIADARSDQFGFCVALHEALYGQRPFQAETFAELVEVVARGERAPLPEGADVPTWLAKVLQRGLAVEPRERWASMDALLAALADDPALRRRKRLLALGLEILTKALDPDHARVVEVYLPLSGLTRREGELSKARTDDARALERPRATKGAGDLGLAPALVGLGEVALDEGDPAAALEPLERAVELSEQPGADPVALATGRFTLARALWDAAPARGGSRPRARELAKLAYAGFPADEFRCREDRAAAREWLDARAE